MILLVSLSSMGANVLLGKKPKTDQLISLYKIVLFYDDNVNELR